MEKRKKKQSPKILVKGKLPKNPKYQKDVKKIYKNIFKQLKKDKELLPLSYSDEGLYETMQIMAEMIYNFMIDQGYSGNYNLREYELKWEKHKLTFSFNEVQK